MRSPAVWLSACSLAVLLAGCGGTEDATPQPQLPNALAERLARDADGVAASLDGGDPCGAAQRAVALQQATVAALNRPGEVPDALKEDLGVAVADVVDRAQSECAAAQPLPAPATTVDEDDGETQGKKRGKGKGKGRGKKDD